MTTTAYLRPGLVWLGGFAAALLFAGPRASPQPLKLVVSIEPPSVTEPFPARITLHLHNAGSGALWLYRHLRDPEVLEQQAASQFQTGEQPVNVTTGGSSLAVHLEPLTAPPPARPIKTPARGEVLESVGLPHPTLVRLAPGGDYEEGCVVHLDPALQAGAAGPLWGRYRLWVEYGARFSNADAVARDAGVTAWTGTVASDPIEIDLEPPPPTATGSVAGTITDEKKRPLADALVSLSDRQEHLLRQLLTDPSGRFSFGHLPLGLYWVTARRALASVDTALFEHVELAADHPAGAVELLLLPPETYEPKQMLHKPVLFRVTASAGQPESNVMLEVVWSSGTVLDTVKGETSEDGTVALNLLPGRNYLTLKRHGCKSQDQHVDVAEGGGIDGFGLTFDCGGK